MKGESSVVSIQASTTHSHRIPAILLGGGYDAVMLLFYLTTGAGGVPGTSIAHLFVILSGYGQNIHLHTDPPIVCTQAVHHLLG